MGKTPYGGKHPNTAALRNVLAAQGVNAPHTNQPYSEAMLFGIGGGLGAGYILWEFKAHESAIIVLGFCNRWNYPTAHLSNLCERIGAKVTIQETGARRAADANLQQALDSGRPVIVWVDKAHLPHQQLPEALKGYAWHVVGAHGADNGNILVDDLADNLFAVSRDVFAAGRGRIGSDKNRLMRVENPAAINLEAAIAQGIRDQLEHLGRDSESFSLPVYKKWAKLMTDSKNKKGWPVVFKSRKGLYSTHRTVYEGIALDGMDGCGLRGLYADFLEEASSVTGNTALLDVAGRYREAAAKWVELAEAALPDNVPAFKETKALLVKRYGYMKRNKLDEMRDVVNKLDQLQADLNADFPMSDSAVGDLFAKLQSILSAIYDSETRALEALRRTL
jgi:hypothetical protein